ncbi:MAG TPA: hypothetical protein VFQ62_10165 [Methylomirabilota bacterium]|jgi:hypothetical protein|nr:hypothetical protein [Methylomirabilota bacterium]
MNARLLVLAPLAITLFTYGCSTAPQSSSTTTSGSPRVRCLADPNEGHTRPLVYLFCIESP